MAPALLIVGAAVSLVITHLFSGRPESWTAGVWRAVRVTPRRVGHFLAYFGIFIVELVRANLNMLRYIYARRIDIHPGVVRVHTRLSSPMARLALANSIALTPGSLVLGLEGEVLYIHWLDVKTTDREEASRLIVGPFEKHLEAAFG
ncbi:Na+/H+ antiporter subunit E [Pseudochelatococcus sp. B33]